MQSLIRNGLELFETDNVYQRENFAKQTSKLVKLTCTTWLCVGTTCVVTSSANLVLAYVISEYQWWNCILSNQQKTVANKIGIKMESERNMT